MSRRRGILAAVAVILTLFAILVLSEPEEDRFDRPPLDPRGTGPDGTAALVELLERRGATVRLGGLPDDGDDVVLQLADTLSGAPSDRLGRWVRAGGRLVVAVPFAPFTEPLDPNAFPSPDSPDSPGRCRIEALAGLERVDPALPPYFLDTPDSSGCFSSEQPGRAGVRLRPLGAGQVVAVAGSGPFVNDQLDDADNAAFALALLSPAGRTVRILDPNRFLSDSEDVGDGTVLGTLPQRGRQALQQLVLAFVVWGVVRGRRLGQPVAEELPVPLPASDLVLAAGRLLDRNGDPADAAERLRRRTSRELGVALGLGPDPDRAELGQVLVDRTRLDPALVHSALHAPVADGAALVTTSAHLDRLHKEIPR